LNHFYLTQQSPLFGDKTNQIPFIGGNHHPSWLYFYTNLITFSKLEKFYSTTNFGLNADEQRLVEAEMNEKEKKNFENIILGRKFNNNTTYYNYAKWNDVEFFIKNFLFKQLTKFKPVFNFFIYNVDKNIKKFSRGKSGKYVFVWKYIPQYKRNNVTLNLIKKNLIFANGLNFRQKLLSILQLVFLNLQQSFLWKTKIFVYNYIYKNYKKTLMTNFKSIK